MTDPDVPTERVTVPDESESLESSAPTPLQRPTVAPSRAPVSPETKAAATGRSMSLAGLDAFYGSAHAVKGITLDYAANEVTAMIGPSGCGKSTVLRCLNRMHEEIPGARAEGKVTLDDLDIYGPGVDVTSVRRAIGMVFQKPNPFPTMSIYDNVAAGLRLNGPSGRKGKAAKQALDEAVERS
ncbi:MAG: phosphate transport system ATP-binding protein, partial [bacterium]